MLKSFDYYHQIEDPDIYLCNPDRRHIGVLHGVDRNLTLRFNDLSEFSFTLPKAMNDTVVDGESLYDKVCGKRLVFVEQVGWFVISNVSDADNGSESNKAVTCQSHQLALNHFGIITENRIYSMYNPDDPYDNSYDASDVGAIPSVVGQLYQQFGIEIDTDGEGTDHSQWTITYISENFKGRYRTLESATSYLYDFMKNTVSKAFEAIFEFDFLYHTIQIKTIDEVTLPTDIYLSYENVLNEIKVDENIDNIVTVLNCNGSNVDITTVNPMGTNYIVNFDYYMQEIQNGDKTIYPWMSHDLIEAINNWKEIYNSNKETYIEKVKELQELYEEKTKLSEKLQFANLKIRDLNDAISGYYESDSDDKEYVPYLVNVGEEKLIAPENLEIIEFNATDGQVVCSVTNNNNVDVLCTIVAQSITEVTILNQPILIINIPKNETKTFTMEEPGKFSGVRHIGLTAQFKSVNYQDSDISTCSTYNSNISGDVNGGLNPEFFIPINKKNIYKKQPSERSDTTYLNAKWENVLQEEQISLLTDKFETIKLSDVIELSAVENDIYVQSPLYYIENEEFNSDDQYRLEGRVELNFVSDSGEINEVVEFAHNFQKNQTELYTIKEFVKNFTNAENGNDEQYAYHLFAYFNNTNISFILSKESNGSEFDVYSDIVFYIPSHDRTGLMEFKNIKLDQINGIRLSGGVTYDVTFANGDTETRYIPINEDVLIKSGRYNNIFDDTPRDISVSCIIQNATSIKFNQQRDYGVETDVIKLSNMRVYVEKVMQKTGVPILEFSSSTETEKIYSEVDDLSIENSIEYSYFDNDIFVRSGARPIPGKDYCKREYGTFIGVSATPLNKQNYTEIKLNRANDIEDIFFVKLTDVLNYSNSYATIQDYQGNTIEEELVLGDEFVYSGNRYKLEVDANNIGRIYCYYVKSINKYALMNTIVGTDGWFNQWTQYVTSLEYNLSTITSAITDKKSEIKEITELCNIRKYIRSLTNGTTLDMELSHYWIEGDFLNENISAYDNITIDEIINLSNDLINSGFIELEKISQPVYSMSVSAINFANLIEFYKFTSQLILGRVITIEKSENKWLYPSLISLSVSFDDLQSFSLNFSNSSKLDESLMTYADLAKQSSSVSRNVSANWSNLMSYSLNKEQIDNKLNNPLNTSLRSDQEKIYLNNFTIDEVGILGRKRDVNSNGTQLDSFSSKQLRITNNQIIFTDDDWEHTKLALGEFKYVKNIDDNGEEVIDTAYGLSAEVLVGDLILGKRLRISSVGNSINLSQDGIDIKKNGYVTFQATSDGDVTVKGTVSGDIYAETLQLSQEAIDSLFSYVPDVTITD